MANVVQEPKIKKVNTYFKASSKLEKIWMVIKNTHTQTYTRMPAHKDTLTHTGTRARTHTQFFKLSNVTV